MRVKSNKFARQRASHRNETAEDYVEMIREIEREQGEVRLIEIARRFGVSSVTAHKILARLQRESYILSKPYRAIFLTDKGRKLADKSHRRHAIVYTFLKQLGVPDDIAQVDAEGIEHHVSPQTLEIFQHHIKEKK